ncbi:hypothetical protein M5K25_008191 [Dendrobium thyrsiflorum]|uniref:Uncharacterized protein n=1 Tax=Dendrobium thyrsiflorum TaxID=117978 RepID=A0ABD0VEW1_DENTH
MPPMIQAGAVVGAGVVGRTKRRERLRSRRIILSIAAFKKAKVASESNKKAIPNKAQVLSSIAKSCFNFVIRLDETNPKSPRKLNSDITKSVKCLINDPRSRESTSAVHPNHSQLTLDLPHIYKPCHSRKSINRALVPSQRKRSKREIIDRLLAPPRPAPGVPLDHRLRRSSAGPPPDAGVPPDHRLTPDFHRTTT